MNIEHATGIENVLSILKNGICPSSQICIKTYPNLSDEDFIYLTVHLTKKTFSFWEDNHFLLKDEWFNDNSSKFYHHYNLSDGFFDMFIIELDLEKLDSNTSDKGYNQLVTRDVIPIEAIDSLIMESKNDLDTFDLIYNSNEQKNIYLREHMPVDIKLIYRNKYDYDFHRVI